MSLYILHLSAADHGGAGIAAARLHEGLRQTGHVSRVLVLSKKTNDADVLILPSITVFFRLRRFVVKALLNLLTSADHYFQLQSLSPGISAKEIIEVVGFRPDVIVVHFISHFLSARDIHQLQVATNARVIWNLIDMATMTGGCHYAWSCDKYKTECHTCPGLLVHSRNDLSAGVWAHKKRYMSLIQGVVVAGSSTLAKQAQSSALLKNMRIETILLGVSPDLFRPRDRAPLRRLFGINGVGPLIFFGAQSFNQRRKGMALLHEAFGLLPESWPRDMPNPSILSAGDASDFGDLGLLGFEYRELGFVDMETLANAYAAADIFVCPSIEDSGPMMINEAMMCGTPVVAFQMGVAPDLIVPGVTGELAELASPRALAAAMASVLGWDATRHAEASVTCRKLAVEKCSSAKQIERFVLLAMELRDSMGAMRTGTC